MQTLLLAKLFRPRAFCSVYIVGLPPAHVAVVIAIASILQQFNVVVAFVFVIAALIIGFA